MGAIIMIVYEATKQLFVEDVVQDRIEENIDRRFYERMGYHTSKSERDAWKNSMQYMLKVLIDNNIPGNVGIAIEFKIPNTSKRIDFIISGKDGKLKNTAIKNGIIFKRNSDSTWTISLYNVNDDDDFHCGEFLLKKYKGGGHKGAAGCTLKESKFIKMLKTKEI